MLISLFFSFLLTLSAVPAMGREATSPPETGAAGAPARGPNVKSALRILPTPAGLAQSGELALYPAEKLTDHIGAAAATYRDYGVIESGSISFAPPAGKRPRFAIDLYRFGEAKNAFGIFRVERGEHAEALDVGAEGAWESGLLSFWQGPYYARIASGASRDSTLACARSLTGLLPTAGDTLIQMGFFPRATINGTERWVPHTYLGIKGLDDVWTATCTDSAGTFQVLFRRNRPPLRDEEVGKAGKIAAMATEKNPVELINLSGEEKGKVLILFFKKMSRYAAGYVGPKPSGTRTTFLANWVDQLPAGR
jgi:hypothetical protein